MHGIMKNVFQCVISWCADAGIIPYLIQVCIIIIFAHVAIKIYLLYCIVTYLSACCIKCECEILEI